MEAVDNSFASRLKKLLALRGCTVQEACDLTDGAVKSNTLNKLIQRGSKPTYDTIDELCHALGVPESYFSKYAPSVGITSQRDSDHLTQKITEVVQDAMHLAQIEAMRQNHGIGTEDFLNWLSSTGGRLENFDAVIETIDLFKVMGPDNRIPEPYRIGKQSAHSLQFHIQDSEQYTWHVSSYPESFIEAIKKGHVEASHRPYMVSDVVMHGTVNDQMVSKKYRRVHAKLTLPDGQQIMAVHAQVIPNSHWSNHESGHLDLIQQHPNHEDARQEA